MRPLITIHLFLFFFTSSLFALSPFEKALLADENGEVDFVIDYLFEALDNPGNQELEIRYLLQDYLVLLNDSKWIDKNQLIINRLESLENANDFKNKKNQESPYVSSPWSQSLYLANNYSILPFDAQEQDLYDHTYYPEIGYTLDYYYYAYGLHHSFNFSINYEQSLFNSSYSINDETSAYNKDIIYYDSLNEYTLNTQFSYFLYDKIWYLSGGIESFKSDYYDLSFGVFSYFGFTPFETELGKLGLNLGLSIHQEFGSEYSLGAKYSKNFLSRILAFNLGYTFSITKANSYLGSSMTAYRSSLDEVDSISINTTQFDFGSYDVKQTRYTNLFSFQVKIKPANTFTMLGDCNYSISQNFERDIWYTPNLEAYSQIVSDSLMINQTQIYQNDLIYRANTTQDYSEAQSIILNQDVLSLLKLKIKGSLKWEFIHDHFLNFSYTEYFQRSLGKETNLESHPFYNENLENSTYLYLEYLVEF